MLTGSTINPCFLPGCTSSTPMHFPGSIRTPTILISIVSIFPIPRTIRSESFTPPPFYRAVSESARRDAGGAKHVSDVCPRSSGASRKTLKQTGLQTYPYHVYVPSFVNGASSSQVRTTTLLPNRSPPVIRFVSVDGLPALFQFPPDMAPLPMPANQLNSQILSATYEND